MMETVITLFLGVRKNRKGLLDREQYVHVLPGRISLYPTSLFALSLCKIDVYFNTGYWR